MTTKTPTTIDRIIGQSIERHRIARDLSQDELAAAIGIPVTQLQRYESGAERIYTSHLQAIAHVLKVRLSTFFADGHDEADVFVEPEVVRLVRAFVAIDDAKLRQYLVGVVEGLAKRDR